MSHGLGKLHNVQSDLNVWKQREFLFTNKRSPLLCLSWASLFPLEEISLSFAEKELAYATSVQTLLVEISPPINWMVSQAANFEDPSINKWAGAQGSCLLYATTSQDVKENSARGAGWISRFTETWKKTSEKRRHGPSMRSSVQANIPCSL